MSKTRSFKAGEQVTLAVVRLLSRAAVWGQTALPVAASIVFSLLAFSLFADVTYYVSPSGDGSAPTSGDYTKAYSHPQLAVDAADGTTPTTIIIDDGTYQLPSTTVATSVVTIVKSNLELKARNPRMAVFDGQTARYGIDRNKAAEWYDGYNVDGIHIYNPNSIVEVCQRKFFDTYWNSTETFEALRKYIILDMDGLREKVERLVSGERVKVNTGKFKNDMVNLGSADDVLALLIHLGYLTYDKVTQQCWIPNNEVAKEFINSIEDDK